MLQTPIPPSEADRLRLDEPWLPTNESFPEVSIKDVDSVKNALREIWADILHDDPSMFADEDIFFEVGGDSISAQQVLIAAKGRGIYLTMEQIFIHASLEDMAETAGTMDTTVHLIKDDLRTDDLLEHGLETTALKCNVSANDIENAYQCSPMQESLLAELDGAKNSYVRQFVFELADDVSLSRFQKAWEDTISANEVLRTRICDLDKVLGHIQVVLRSDGQWNTLRVNLSQFLEWDSSVHMLTGGSFFRYTVILDEDDKGTQRRHFVWTVHHALCDGASIPEIFHDVATKYRNGTVFDREPFESFIRSAAIMPESSLEQAYWKRALSGIRPTPYPSLPQDPAFRAQPTALFQHSLALDVLSTHGVTKALLLRAAWAILLSHYNGTEDIGFGVINNGRTAAVLGVSEMTGPTINLVPIALHVDPEELVTSFLSRIRVQAAKMIPFEHSGISKIRKHLVGDDTTALDFQTLFVVHPTSFTDAVASSLQTLGLTYVDELGKKEHHPYPLVLTLTLSAGKAVDLSIQYDERIVSTRQVKNIANHFQVVLTQLGNATAETKLSALSPFSVHDLSQIRQWNGFTPPVEHTCIDLLFRNQVERQPDAIAVCSREESLTYLDVETYSSSLASHLAGLGVRTGTFVGVCFEKSIWTVVAILAVFKAGGVYVPIDPAHPRGRIEEVVTMACIDVALASQTGTDVLHGLAKQIITVSKRPPPVLSDMTPPSNSLPSSTAYLLFTSGSTGKPKGILMSHAAICTSIIHHGAAFAAGPHWRTLQFGAHTFDLSIGEFFTTLSHGGCICVPSEHERLNDLAGAISSLSVNTLLVVPTVANLLTPRDAPTLKTIILAGEPITRETVVRWADSVDLTCAYGPSETAVWCSGNLRVSSDAHPGNIGRSIGATMWIANPDNYHQLSAIGCVGEIVISGALLGEGYFRDRTITEAAWVSAPTWLKETTTSAGSYDKLYRSGDLARYNPDGTFQIVGRRDTQVKLRGFRIELGEIENQMMATGLVTAAFASLPTAGPCARQIVAVVCTTKPDLNDHNNLNIVISKTGSLVVERLKAQVSFALPEYMVPTLWIVLVKMPLLISGKIDRKSIKSWIQNMDYTVYKGFIEESSSEKVTVIVPGSFVDKLRNLWGEVLRVPTELISTQSSFIALGGDSIAAIQIVSRAKDQGLPVTVRGIISTRTLGKLATLLEHSTVSTTPASHGPNLVTQPTVDIFSQYKEAIRPRLENRQSVQVEEVYPLAPFQREIMRARKMNPNVFVLSWQMEVFSRNNNQIDLMRLAHSWRRVVQKYPILRSIFLHSASAAENMPAVQVVLTKDAEPEMAISAATSEQVEPSFATTTTPSVDDCFLPHRAHFVQHGNRYFIHLELDHLVIDGWSLKIIKEAILAAYEDEGNVPASDEPPSYKAFVDAHHTDRVKADDQYWRSALRNHKPSNLPGKISATPHRNSNEKTIIYLPELETQTLKQFSVQNGITPASIFDAAWAQTLSVYTGSPNVAFEYVVSGRDEDILGVFDIAGPLINVLPYHLKGVSTAVEDLAALAQRMQDQRAQDSLHTSSNVREVIEAELGILQMFNTALNYQRRPTAVESERLRIDDDLRKSRDPWHFDVLLRVMHVTDDDTFKPSFEFDDKLFDVTFMNQVAQDFWNRVHSILQ